MKLPINYAEATWAQRKQAREMYIEQQEGKCWYCGGLLEEYPPEEILKKRINWRLFPPNFKRYPVLHHNHKTHMTIGSVHAYCNAVLWQYHGE